MNGRAAGNEADGFNGGFRDADVKQVDQLLQIDFAYAHDFLPKICFFLFYTILFSAI